MDGFHSTHRDKYPKMVTLNFDSISRLPKWFRDEIMEKSDSLHLRKGRSFADIFVDFNHGRLRGLKNLDIVCKDSYLEAEVEIRQSYTGVNPVLENLGELYFSGDWEKACATVQTLPPGSLSNLKHLSLFDCGTKENILLPLTISRRLPNLEKIKISKIRGSRYLFGYDELPDSQLLKLRCIRLGDCDIVRICEGPAPSKLFQNLESLYISYCNNLEGSLFTHDVAQCLSQLDSLTLAECSLLERIVEASYKKTVLPKLKGLHLQRLPVLCYDSATFDIECPSLERFWMKKCPKCEISSDDFHSRKQVKLERCPVREQEVDEGEDGVYCRCLLIYNMCICGLKGHYNPLLRNRLLQYRTQEIIFNVGKPQ